MKVKELRKELEKALDRLDEYDDEQKVDLVTNTYFLGNCHVFLGISGFDGGYVNLDNPVDEDEYDDEESD